MALEYYQKGVTSCLYNFNDTINVSTVPEIKDYLEWNQLLKALQAKAQIFTDTTITLSKFEFLAKFDRQKIAIKHYQACDTLITEVRQKISAKSDKLALGEKADEIYIKAVDVCLQLANTYDNSKSPFEYQAQAFHFSEKNKASILLESLAGSEAQKFAGIPDSLLEKEKSLNIEVALYTKTLAEQPDSAKEVLFKNKLFEANREYEKLIKQFETDYPKYYNLKYGNELVPVKKLQKSLDKKTALLSYTVTDSSIIIFTITRKKLEVQVVEKDARFDNILQLYRDILMSKGSQRAFTIASQYFYRTLIPDNLPKKIENLIIIPDGILASIPFETFLTEKYPNLDSLPKWKDFSFLIKDYNISYSYSANLFYKTFPKEKTKEVEVTPLNEWLAFAPVFDNSKTAGLAMRTRKLLQEMDSIKIDSVQIRGTLISGGYVSPLPGTEIEVKKIFKQFDDKGKKALAQIHENANEAFVKSDTLKRYKYLHFATHGFVNMEKPELSGILLAQDTTINEDGILYTGEIYNLELNADLTVLSACETGLGKVKKGEGIIGLTRALLYAGSKNIIVSLWAIADESTKDLMIDFYGNLLLQNVKENNFGEPLRKAKIKMINEGVYAHPFYWSPFILIGK